MKIRSLIQVIGAFLAVCVPAGIALPLWAACVVWGMWIIVLAGFLGDRQIPFRQWKVKLLVKWQEYRQRERNDGLEVRRP